MPQPINPLNVSVPWVDKPGTPSKFFREYFLTLDAFARGLFGFFAGATFATRTSPASLIAVAAPSNANAAAAGVPVGSFYTTTADPHIVYIRTA